MAALDVALEAAEPMALVAADAPETAAAVATV